MVRSTRQALSSSAESLIPVAERERRSDASKGGTAGRTASRPATVCSIRQRHARVGPIRLVPFSLIGSAVFPGRRQRELELMRAVQVHRDRHALKPFAQHGRTEERLPSASTDAMTLPRPRSGKCA